MEFVIREATTADAKGILEFAKKVGSQTENLSFDANGFSISVQEEADFLEESRNSARNIFFVALKNDSIVGTANFSVATKERLKHRGSIGISVLKEEWGNHIGTALMERLIDFAKNEAKCDLVYLEVRSDNERAINLYKKFGFKKTGVMEGFFKINGKLIDCDFMILKLQG